MDPHPCPQADRRALNITLNSIGTELTRDDRRKLYANFGLLYPHGQVRRGGAAGRGDSGRLPGLGQREAARPGQRKAV